MKLIIAGGRDFRDYDLLERECKIFIAEQTFLKSENASTLNSSDITTISGKAMGADLLGERFSSKYGFNILEFPADWDSHGRSAGPIRNAEMARNATHCICFWDGESNGTKNMIENCKKFNLVYKIIYYKKIEWRGK